MNDPKPEPTLTPALFTSRELSIIRTACRDADSDLARRFLAAALLRAEEKLKKKAPK